MKSNPQENKKHIFLSLEELFGKETLTVENELKSLFPNEKNYYAMLKHYESKNEKYTELYFYMNTSLQTIIPNELARMREIVSKNEKYVPHKSFPISYFYKMYKSLKELALKQSLGKQNQNQGSFYQTYSFRERPEGYFLWKEKIQNGYFIHYQFFYCHKEENMYEKMGLLDFWGTTHLVKIEFQTSEADIFGFHSPVDLSKYSLQSDYQYAFPPLTLFEVIKCEEKEVDVKNEKNDQEFVMIMCQENLNLRDKMKILKVILKPTIKYNIYQKYFCRFQIFLSPKNKFIEENIVN